MQKNSSYKNIGLFTAFFYITLFYNRWKKCLKLNKPNPFLHSTLLSIMSTFKSFPLPSHLIFVMQSYLSIWMQIRKLLGTLRHLNHSRVFCKTWCATRNHTKYGPAMCQSQIAGSENYVCMDSLILLVPHGV